MSFNAPKTIKKTEEAMTPLEKANRDRFINEYLVDWRGPQAWIRAGGSESNASIKARELLKEPYVARKIREQVDLIEQSQLINRNRVLAGLVREANYLGVGASHSARVAAYTVLAKILGMEASIKVDHEIRGGVMLIPAGVPVEDWEKNAIDVQSQLKLDVRK